MLIDPKIIYLGYALEGVRGLSILMMFVAMFLMAIGYGNIAYCSSENERVLPWMKRMALSGVVIFFISALVKTFVPDQETYYGMVVASYITKDNYELWKSEGEAIVDYIFEKVQEGNKENR